MSRRSISVGVIGARGHVGAELIALIAGHPQLQLAYVSSRERAGQRLVEHHPELVSDARYAELTYVQLDPAQAAMAKVDAVLLALPNGMAAAYVDAIERVAEATVIVDLSADFRFDDGWFYGLPELTRRQYRGQRRISNPGCYATAMQLAIAPMLGMLDGPAQCFGVSGYSGAGTSPSDKNDPAKLRDNLMPYQLTGHIHEREVSRQLGHPVEFMPHVAAYFRGITLTANLHLTQQQSIGEVRQRYRDAYADEPLVRVLDDAPWVSRIAYHHHAEVGGFTVSADARRLVVVATLDNLLKGAATQALQNLNLAFGLNETAGVPL